MDAEALQRYGEAAAFLCSPEARYGGPPRAEFVLQLNEARAEWKRRKLSGEIDAPTGESKLIQEGPE
jgi:hypothetical protein